MKLYPASSSPLTVFATTAVAALTAQVASAQRLYNLNDILENPNFSVLQDAVALTGVSTALSGDGPLTLFAPSDTAFDALDEYSPGTLARWLAQDPPVNLSAVLLYHVANGVTDLGDIINGTTTLGTLALEELTLSPPTDESPAMVNAAQITAADVPASNGVS